MMAGWKKQAVRAGAVVAGAVLVLSGQTASASAAQATIGPYRFVNQSSGKCLEVADWRTDDGAPIRQWDCTGGANQKWRLVSPTEYATGSWALVNVNSGKCVVGSGDGSLASGTELRQVTCTGWQTWIVSNYPNPEDATIRTGDLALEIGGFSGAQGAPAQVWWWNGGANQRWWMQPTTG
ncbi:RICIN domain-containing protein [Kitasatospora sp. NPDC097605]|uniref:RICIN domain-containing protein n=1 Tax=Kitasatospora sp. NPDC097605 TaxID=3157226 RepID=UPI00331EF5DD